MLMYMLLVEGDCNDGGAHIQHLGHKLVMFIEFIPKYSEHANQLKNLTIYINIWTKRQSWDDRGHLQKLIFSFCHLSKIVVFTGPH